MLKCNPLHHVRYRTTMGSQRYSKIFRTSFVGNSRAKGTRHAYSRHPTHQRAVVADPAVDQVKDLETLLLMYFDWYKRVIPGGMSFDTFVNQLEGMSGTAGVKVCAPFDSFQSPRAYDYLATDRRRS